MVEPVRFQMSRRKGFNLNALSESTNGLPAVVVSRPSIFGNPFTRDDAIASQYATLDTWRAFVVECFEDWLGPSQSGRDWWQGPKSDRQRAAINEGLSKLRGKNLACWCRPGDPCHADVLLKLANRPTCEGSHG